jgi:hypothetical protein
MIPPLAVGASRLRRAPLERRIERNRLSRKARPWRRLWQIID